MFTEQNKKNEEKFGDERDFIAKVISNPITGRLVMAGSAMRFQNAVMHLIGDYEKKGIKSVPVSLLSDFIMQSTLESIEKDIIDRADDVGKIFEAIKEVQKCK